MAENDNMLEMDSKKNAKIKKALMKTGVFEKASYTPYIGDEYEDAEEKILFIGDCKLPQDKRFFKDSKDFPKVNYCTQIISYCNQNTSIRRIRDEIKEKMYLGENERPTFAYPQRIQKYLEQNKVNYKKIAYFNFIYDRFDKDSIRKISIPSGDDLEQYFKTLFVIIDKLNPEKIIYIDEAIFRTINNRKQTAVFNNKKFDMWIEEKEIKKEILSTSSSCNKSNENQIENSDNSIRNDDVLNESIKLIKIVKDKLEAFFKEKLDISEGDFLALIDGVYNDPIEANNLYVDKLIESEGDTWKIWNLMIEISKIKNNLERLKRKIDEKKVYQTRQEQIIEKKAKYIEYMLDLTESERLYIGHTLIPSFFKYIDPKYELEKEMPEGEQHYSSNEFNEFLKERFNANKLEKSNGIGKTLNAIYKFFQHNPDKSKRKYAEMMKKSIFIADSNRRIWQLWDKKTLVNHKYKMWNPNVSIKEQ